MIVVESANQQARAVNTGQLAEAVRQVAQDHEYQTGEISVAIVDDPAIHRLNREYLDHDYATDVLSFLLEESDNHLDGQIVASADTAARLAPEYGWTMDDELLLYVIHGALHLVGWDDHDPVGRRRMRELEVQYLARYQRYPRFDADGRRLTAAADGRSNDWGEAAL